ncbi:hypothetical protein ACKKBG_A24125 [Auxenochlorella protothecoides x Auxenochlorella symbiontica]
MLGWSPPRRGRPRLGPNVTKKRRSGPYNRGPHRHASMERLSRDRSPLAGCLTHGQQMEPVNGALVENRDPNLPNSADWTTTVTLPERPTIIRVPLHPPSTPVTVRHCAEARFPEEPPGSPVIHIAWCGRYTHGGFEPGTVAAAHEAGATHTPCPDAEPAAQRCPASPPSPSLSDLCLELLASPPSPPPEGMQGCLLTLDLEAGAWGSWQPGATLGPADLALGRPGQHRQDTPLSPFSSSLRGLPTLCPDMPELGL